MMKILKEWILLMTVLMALASCGGGGEEPASGEPPSQESRDNTPPENPLPDDPPPDVPPSESPPPVSVPGSSLNFTVNEANVGATMNYDYGVQTVIPTGFGEGEFTFEIWIKPDANFPFGPTQTGGDSQLTNWSDSPADPQPTDGSGWWYAGNFLLDGHANAGNGRGTFSLQIYAGGRVRWHLYDSAGEWIVQAADVTAAPYVVDGNWHQITLVRRWSGDTDALLELWIDGAMVAQQTTFVRDNLRSYWDGWSEFRVDNEGWFWGTEKLAAVGYFDRYEDYKGMIDELRLWAHAKTASEIQNNYQNVVTGSEAGLVGLFQFSEGSGDRTCNSVNVNAIAEGDCIGLINMKEGYWSLENAPLID